jgi:hypothetical protein
MRRHRWLLVCLWLGSVLVSRSSRAQGGGEILGYVCDVVGQPIGGVEVVVSDTPAGAGPSQRAYTSDEGMFVIRGVPAGRREVRVTDPRLRPAMPQIGVVVPGRKVDVTFVVEVANAPQVSMDRDPTQACGPWPRQTTHRLGTLAVGVAGAGSVAPTSRAVGLAPGGSLLTLWTPGGWAGGVHLSAEVLAPRPLLDTPRASWQPITLSTGLTIFNLFFAGGGPVDLFGSVSLSRVLLRADTETSITYDPGLELGLRLLWQSRRWMPWASASIRGAWRRGSLETKGDAGAPMFEANLQLGLAYVRDVVRQYGN